MFSQTTEYALRAMACLALEPDRLVPTADVAEKTKVPSNYLSKVLQQLAARKLITGRRGVGGGYRLARPAQEIALLEIIQSVGTLTRIEACPLGLATHGHSLCPLHKTMDKAAAVLIELFEGVTLSHLISDPTRPNRPLCETGTAAALTVSAGRR
jgi:Rrf2 family protein